MKKKILVMVSVLTSVGLLIVGGFNYYSGQKEAEYITTAVPYVKMVIPEISKWDPVVAREHISTEFMKKISEDKFDQTLLVMSKLGELQALEEPHFEEVYATEKQTVISYTVNARYSTDEAKITIALLDHGGVFKVYNFNVESEALGR